jgi:hypothetical protein
LDSAEDCLYRNVTRAIGGIEGSRPVVVWSDVLPGRRSAWPQALAPQPIGVRPIDLGAEHHRDFWSRDS